MRSGSTRSTNGELRLGGERLRDRRVVDDVAVHEQVGERRSPSRAGSRTSPRGGRAGCLRADEESHRGNAAPCGRSYFSIFSMLRDRGVHVDRGRRAAGGVGARRRAAVRRAAGRAGRCPAASRADAAGRGVFSSRGLRDLVEALALVELRSTTGGCPRRGRSCATSPSAACTPTSRRRRSSGRGTPAAPASCARRRCADPAGSRMMYGVITRTRFRFSLRVRALPEEHAEHRDVAEHRDLLLRARRDVADEAADHDRLLILRRRAWSSRCAC